MSRSVLEQIDHRVAAGAGDPAVQERGVEAELIGDVLGEQLARLSELGEHQRVCVATEEIGDEETAEQLGVKGSRFSVGCTKIVRCRERRIRTSSCWTRLRSCRTLCLPIRCTRSWPSIVSDCSLMMRLRICFRRVVADRRNQLM